MLTKSFTVLELILAVIILAILCSVGLYAWTDVADKVKEGICAQNQLIIEQALRIYMRDNNGEAPTSLSRLVPVYTDFAIASLNKNRPHSLAMRRIYIALLNIDEVIDGAGKGWASNSFRDYVGGGGTIGKLRILTCPSQIGGGISYALIEDLQAAGAGALNKLIELENNDYPIICDSNNTTFSVGSTANPNGHNARIDTGDLAFRHGRRPGVEKRAVVAGGKREACSVSETRNWDRPYRQLVTPPSGEVRPEGTIGGHGEGGDDTSTGTGNIGK